MIKITIETGNESFAPEDPEGWRMEVSSMLHQVAASIQDGRSLPLTLLDGNGNRVGLAENLPPAL